MKEKIGIMLTALFLLCMDPSYGCSAFLLTGEGYCVIGFNENWKPMPGIMVINKRDIQKESLSWKKLTTMEKADEKTVCWRSKYGSVSFNLLGADLPCYGVNEKGLFVVELALDNTFSKPDSSKASMFWAQWIQYQLDNYATVKEVINNLKCAPVIDWWPHFTGSHFFVADKEGNTAAIELIDGKIQVSSGNRMPVPVLCNDPYQSELARVKEYRFMNGEKAFDIYSQKWEDRFAKATCMIKSYNPAVSPVAYSWQVLDSIKPGNWQIVADLKNGIIYFRSDLGKEIKRLDMAKCKFDLSLPVMFMDINSGREGNVNDCLTELTPELNDGYIAKGFPVGYVDDRFPGSDDFRNIRINLRKYYISLREQAR